MDVSGQSVQCSGWVSQRSVSPPVEATQLLEAAWGWVELFILEPLTGWLRASGEDSLQLLMSSRLFWYQHPQDVCSAVVVCVCRTTASRNVAVARACRRAPSVPVAPDFSSRSAAVRQT